MKKSYIYVRTQHYWLTEGGLRSTEGPWYQNHSPELLPKKLQSIFGWSSRFWVALRSWDRRSLCQSSIDWANQVLQTRKPRSIESNVLDSKCNLFLNKPFEPRFPLLVDYSSMGHFLWLLWSPTTWFGVKNLHSACVWFSYMYYIIFVDSLCMSDFLKWIIHNAIDYMHVQSVF